MYIKEYNMFWENMSTLYKGKHHKIDHARMYFNMHACLTLNVVVRSTYKLWKIIVQHFASYHIHVSSFPACTSI